MLLTTPAEIKGALATMDPLARLAAQKLTEILLADPTIFQDEDRIEEAQKNGMSRACEQTYGVMTPDSLEAFVFLCMYHRQAILTVGASVAVYVIEEEQRKNNRGWLGTAAAVGVGILLGSIFG